MRTPSGVAYHPSVPRHLQIQRVLRGRIESGEWEGGRPIPTEMELLAEFGVSRTTIREALGVLTRDGLIARHRGRGSFVQPRDNGPAAVTNLILGYQAQIKVITAETIPAPAHIVGPLRVERGTPVMRLVRLEIVDGAPLAVVVNYIGPSLGQRIRALRKKKGYTLRMLIEEVHFLEQAVYDLVQKNWGTLDVTILISELNGFQNGLHAIRQRFAESFARTKKAAKA